MDNQNPQRQSKVKKQLKYSSVNDSKNIKRSVKSTPKKQIDKNLNSSQFQTMSKSGENKQTLPPIKNTRTSQSAPSPLRKNIKQIYNSDKGISDEEQEYLEQCEKLIINLQRFTQLSRKKHKNREKTISFDASDNHNLYSPVTMERNRVTAAKLDEQSDRHIIIKIPIIAQMASKKKQKSRRFKYESFLNLSGESDCEQKEQNPSKETFRQKFNETMNQNKEKEQVSINQLNLQQLQKKKAELEAKKAKEILINKEKKIVEQKQRKSGFLRSLGAAKSRGNSLETKIKKFKKRINVDGKVIKE